MLNVLWSSMAKQARWDILAYGSEKKKRSYVEGAVMSNVKLDAWVVAVGRSLIEKKQRGGRHQEEYTNTNGRVWTLQQSKWLDLLENFVVFVLKSGHRRV